MAFVCSGVFLVSCQQTAAGFVSSPKPVVGKLLREFKNGPRLCSGCSRQGQTQGSLLEARPDSTPETEGLGAVQVHWGSPRRNKGPSHLVSTLHVCLGHLKFCQDRTCQVVLCRKAQDKGGSYSPSRMHFNFSAAVSCPGKH